MRLMIPLLLLHLAVHTLGTLCATQGLADEDSELPLQFEQEVLPLLQKYCVDCHGSEDPDAMFDITRFEDSGSVARGFMTWQHVVDRVAAGEMPPTESEQPSQEAKRSLVGWSKAFRRREANRNAGDPGPVLPRRLNVHEYNNTIRDLTGVDIQPAKEFPVDRANLEGFDNTGESLDMTPGLLMKYLEAARHVSEHLVLGHEGIDFAPHPVLVDTDRDKYFVKRIVAFYERQNTDLASYFFAAWRLSQNADDADANRTLVRIAEQEKLSPKYLRTVHDLLSGNQDNFGPIARLRELWSDLPKDADQRETAREGCRAMSDYVESLRAKLVHSFGNLSHQGINNGTQAFVLRRNRLYASHRRTLNEKALKAVSLVDRSELLESIRQKNVKIGNRRDVLQKKLEVELEKLIEETQRNVREKELTRYQAKKKIDGARKAMDFQLGMFKLEEIPNEDLTIPVEPEKKQKHIAAFKRFCSIFPDRFYVKSRGRDYKGLQGEQLANEARVRFLSAGFHSQMGFFRDDGPLYELLLSEIEQKELDSLWLGFDIFADISRRQHQGYLWYERSESGFISGPEFDFARGENEEITSQENIQKLASLYIAKAKRTGASDEVLRALEEHFLRVNSRIRLVESERALAQAQHLKSVTDFAMKAFRRPLSKTEKDSIRIFYDALRSQNGLTHEDAMRDLVVWIIASPKFGYALMPSDEEEQVHLLSQFSLASRLSYLLWASMPDAELLKAAEQGRLGSTEEIRAQVRRMVQDERIRGFASQFAGSWLGYSAFENHKGVNQQRFPQFDDSMRQSMLAEPSEFFVDLLRRDGSLNEMLEAKHTFVDTNLAKLYGMVDVDVDPGEWVLVDNANEFGRGGIIPMSVFLTKNAHPLRTSPVQRGNWVVQQLLGERIPPPPGDVPDLPEDESSLDELSLVQVLAKHRENESCAGCHDRFDSLGVTLEAYDPIGRWREVDMAGRSVESKAIMPDGVARGGIQGLREYILENRRQDFEDNATKKLLSYALGRTLIVSDDLLLESMRAKMNGSHTGITGLLEIVVTSPQFLRQRGRNFRNDFTFQN
ncbi:MAG: DUF1592 domain-containing protein [Planctomycetota bacterium]